MRRIQAWLDTRAGRTAGVAATVALAVLAVVLGRLAVLDTGVGGPGRLGLELSGSAQVAARWVPVYGRSEIVRALGLDALSVLCWSPLLALLALWTGRNYRTVSARRLGGPLATVALGAGALGLLADLFVLLGCGAAGADPWSPAWQLAATASWARWLAVLPIALYAAGGLLSLLLGRRVRAVLQEADAVPREGDGRPSAAEVRPHCTTDRGRLGLAFSGGGIRAASISLGALQSLERGADLGWAAADHVTSVSGGSYMTGAWSIARTDPAPLSTPHEPLPWARGGAQPGPEERHLRHNLGYLLSNSPRGSGDDSMDRSSTRPSETTRARRLPAVVATVLTGMALNAAVFFAVMWVLAQLTGWFYRWYFGLTCRSWRLDRPLALSADGECLVAPGRVGWPVLAWLLVGVVAVLAWVGLARATNAAGRRTPPAWLLVPKFLGYGGLAVGGALAAVLVALPALIAVLWRPIAGHDLLTSIVTVAGTLGSLSAVLRILRKPLARFAPALGGAVFGALLLFLLCRWALGAMVEAPQERDWVRVLVTAVALLALHLAGPVELWSLASFYRGRLRSAFATYRDETGVRVRTYANGTVAAPPDRPEPALSDFRTRDPAAGGGTPLSICASATVTGRSMRTHYGIPALSVTFSPRRVRLFAPRNEDGMWDVYECSAADLETLRPHGLPRLTTMMAVALSGAAVSPAMGRFRIGPVSMLLAFANVRLGAWIPNPRYAAALAAQGIRLPRPGLGYLFKEFLGIHDPSDLYLYVTDGGHWENTGLVELLRTAHHREIVCVDADSGPGNLATSIARAIDLAQLECAARVVIDLDALRADRDPSPGHDYSPRSMNLGLVHRTDAGPWRLSLFWYCKPALTHDMPPHLLAYREVDPTFPRVSTLDQFFHGAQFSAYRDLGRYNADKIVAARSTLQRGVRRHDTYVGYAAEVRGDALDAFLDSLAGPEEAEPPEPWVLPELADLVDHLALDAVPAGRARYAQQLYDAVREALG